MWAITRWGGEAESHEPNGGPDAPEADLRERRRHARPVHRHRGCSAFAASQLGKNTVGTKQLKKNAVTTAKIKNEAVTAAKVKKGTLTGTQINASTLGTVPTAQTARESQTSHEAETAATANALAPSEPWHEVTSLDLCTTIPVFVDWEPAGGEFAAPAYYRDQVGIVHLRGAVKCQFAASGLCGFPTTSRLRPKPTSTSRPLWGKAP